MKNELERELEFYLEQEIEANRQMGMTPAEARIEAFGAWVEWFRRQEECRDMRRTE